MSGYLWLTYLLILHFIADFLLQSREMGQRKSNSFRWLVKHGFIHFLTFLIGYVLVVTTASYIDGGFFLAKIMFLVSILVGGLLSFVNCLLHMAVDATTWNVYKLTVVKRKKDIPRDELKKKFKYWEDPWFYHTIGIDQILHILTIAVVYHALIFGR